MLKKWLSLGITMLATVSLAACGNSGSTKKTTSQDDQSAKIASLKKENRTLKKHKQSQSKKVKKASSSAKQSGQSSSSVASSTASSATTTSSNSADHAKAESLRSGIVSSSNGTYSASELAKVPDTVILAAEKQSASVGGDVGYIGQLVAQQYPSIKSQASSESYEKGPTAPTLLSEGDLAWGGAAQKASFDAAAQAEINKGQRIAGFKLVSGSKYDVYFVGTDFPSMSVDIATGEVGD